MSKVSFRARALDSGKPLPLFYEEELPDLSEYVAINRTVPQMPTGMEKEEESERHLQKVMNARQNLKDTTDMVIPIPEAAIPVPDYSNVYQKIRGQPYTYIRMPGLGPDEELPDYDLDSEDEEWLSVQSRERPLSPLHFECMMDRLEKGSGNTVLSEHDAQVLLKDDDDLVMAVYDYWLAKRLRLSRPLIPSVKNERREGTSSSNPYLAFRKRTEKMQTRKNRKNDEQAYMHMLKLKRDLTRSVTLLELMKEREQRKYDYALIQAEIFRKRYLLQDWSGSLISSLKPNPPPNSTGRRLSTPDNSKWEGKNLLMKGDYFDESDGVVQLNTKTKKKRRKGQIYTPTMLDQESPLATIGLSKNDKELKEPDKVDLHEERIDVEELDGPFTFKRKIHLRYHKSRSFTSWPWDGERSTDNDVDQELPLKRKKYCFSHTTLNGRQLGFSRRRIGRGGRSIWDFVPEARVPKSDNLLDFGSYNGEQEEQFNGSSLMDSSPSHDHQLSLLQSGQDKEQEVKRPHFHPVSPKSVSSVDFEFVNLPFIDPLSYPCPELNKEYSHFTGQSLNDEDEGVSSFSSLPTSQFTLRPCVNPEQTAGLLERSHHHPESSKDINSSSLREDQQKMVADEVVWKKFTQSQIDSKHVATLLPSSVGESCSNSQSSSSSTNSMSLNIPSTHLSSLETGLPIQIHVDSLMHFPKKDSKGSLPSENKPHTPSSLVSASSNTATTTNSKNTTTSTLSTGGASATTTTAVIPPNQSNKSQPIAKEALVWFKDCPSSSMLSLNNDISRRNRNNRFRCTLPSSLAKSVTTRFKTEVKPEQHPQPPPQALPSIVPNVPPPPLPLSSPAVAVSPSSPSPHPLLSNQHQIVSSLISDPKKFESFVRDKKHFVTTISSNSHQNNNSSNGTAASLELNHTSKLPLTDSSSSAVEKTIKHTLAARTAAVVNHNSSGIPSAESGSGNVLVKLSSGNPPSEVT